MKMQDVLTTVNGKPIAVHDVVDFLKLHGVFRNTIFKLIEIEVLSAKAQELGLGVTQEELDVYCESKRRMMGLAGTMEITNFCRMHGIKWEQWKALASHEVIRQKVKNAIITDKLILDFYNKNSEKLQMVCLARIVLKDREQAEEILQTIRQGKGDFTTLAREYSLEHQTRIAGGYVGCFKRGMLPRDVESSVFSCRVKDVAGPFLQSGQWSIYQVEEILRTELNEATKSHIADKLFVDWLQRSVLTAKT